MDDNKKDIQPILSVQNLSMHFTTKKRGVVDRKSVV